MQRTDRETPAHRVGGPRASGRPGVVMLRYTGDEASVATDIAPQRFANARGAVRRLAAAEPAVVLPRQRSSRLVRTSDMRA